MNTIQPIRPNFDPTYTTPSATKAVRLALKVYECARSILATISHLFAKGSHIERGQLLRAGDIEHNLTQWGITHDMTGVLLPDGMEMAIRGSNQTEGFVAFPYVVKGFFRDHIVTFAVDHTNKEIIFYDSKGHTVADHGLEHIYNTFKAKHADYRLVQNIRKEQYDAFNCGMYVLKVLKDLHEERSSSSLDMFTSVPPYSYEQIMQARRGEVKAAPTQDDECSSVDDTDSLLSFDMD
jgi:hypothetical protein